MPTDEESYSNSWHCREAQQTLCFTSGLVVFLHASCLSGWCRHHLWSGRYSFSLCVWGMQTSAAHAQWEIQPGPAGGGVYSSTRKDQMKSGRSLHPVFLASLSPSGKSGREAGLQGRMVFLFWKSCYSKDLSEAIVHFLFLSFGCTVLYFCLDWVNKNTSIQYKKTMSGKRPPLLRDEHLCRVAYWGSTQSVYFWYSHWE